MHVTLRYGRAGLDVRLPSQADVTVIRKPQMPLLDEQAVYIQRALEPVSDIAKGKKTACILVCDITRPVPNGAFLTPLLDALVAGGIDTSDITVLVATGLHRPNEGSELLELLGDDAVLRRVRVLNHDALDRSTHRYIGKTVSGTEVRLDRRFVEADLKIATGLVEPHFMAGYSGGRKVVAPGIASADTIRTLHSARFMEHPATASCNLEDNPLHLEQVEIIDMLRVRTGSEIYAINTVIDEARRLAFFNFGEIELSHTDAVAFAAQYLSVPVPRRFATVLTSAAGFPLDQTYYQTVKGMVTPLDIAQDDATLIVASACSEGLGSIAYRAAQRRLIQAGNDSFLNSIMNKPMADIDEWESEMQLKAQRRVNVQMYSDELPAEDRELTGVELVADLTAAVASSIQRSGDPAVAVIPEGPYVIPMYRRAA